ncbi:hypothetical protein J4Q44_G00175860 [Coregonus suidteri]|uniref:Uncharacterized protein n=1 Tax=Coregonus suidteri TaxID=861788 RepID=A0AAN8LNT4_9TELE
MPVPSLLSWTNNSLPIQQQWADVLTTTTFLEFLIHPGLSVHPLPLCLSLSVPLSVQAQYFLTLPLIWLTWNARKLGFDFQGFSLPVLGFTVINFYFSLFFYVNGTDAEFQ